MTKFEVSRIKLDANNLAVAAAGLSQLPCCAGVEPAVRRTAVF